MIRKLLFLLLVICFCNSGTIRAGTSGDSLFRSDVQRWFDAWWLVSDQVYQLPEQQPVTFVFFDEHNIYTTSSVTAPQGKAIPGPDFAGRQLKWLKTPLSDSITLPDHRRLPAGLVSFASPLEDKSFFIMPLLSYWEQADVTSNELGLDNLVTAVFLHEFSHTQQMQNFGIRVTELDRAYAFGVPFSDDIIQNLFEQDSNYVSVYHRELQLFYDALSEQDSSRKRMLIKKGLNAMAERQNKFLSPRNQALPEIEAVFLTMEGIGQYSQYVWLVHPDGGGLPSAQVIKGMRRGGTWWSQDEGQVLFLLLAQLSQPRRWVKQMFAIGTENIVRLLRQQLDS